MILPIVAYGNIILRKKSVPITNQYEGLDKLIENMWDTLYKSNGVGLAAPQVNKGIRLFIVDSAIIFTNSEEPLQYNDAPGIKRVFINAEIISFDGDEWPYNEGCLSIPKIREDVNRPDKVTLKYVDENFEEHIDTFEGITARIIQHEYDHIEGKLFIDHIAPIKRKLLQPRLLDISKGKIKTEYKMLFSGR